jgi:hypothetical protein
MIDWRKEEIGNDTCARDRKEWIMRANQDVTAGHAADEYANAAASTARTS